MTLFPWLFISTLLIYKIRGAWFLLLAVIDLALATTVAVGVGLQANYLPATESGCSGSRAATWQVLDNNKSFFVLAQEISNRKSPSDSCKDFVSDWQLATSS